VDEKYAKKIYHMDLVYNTSLWRINALRLNMSIEFLNPRSISTEMIEKVPVSVRVLRATGSRRMKPSIPAWVVW
jgi:hypothetical protein